MCKKNPTESQQMKKKMYVSVRADLHMGITKNFFKNKQELTEKV